MFVLKSKYKAMESRLRNEIAEETERGDYYYSRYYSLMDTHQDLKDKYQDLNLSVSLAGGLDAIRRKNAISNSQFSESDLKKLRMLCHPDRHDGKPMAIEMLQKINAMVGK